MGRRFIFCPTCNKLTWARRKGHQCFCLRCRKEILENGSAPQADNFTMMEDHVSYPEINRTGGVS